jgi:ATP-dependent helicase/nuclease subunit A
LWQNLVYTIYPLKTFHREPIPIPAFGFSRPDRVMIGDNEVIVVDYKFGDAEESRYLSQVRHYVLHIREMGYDNVLGYVFYVRLKKVVKVEC